MMKEIMMSLRKDQRLPVAGFAWNLNPQLQVRLLFKIFLKPDFSSA
jgi:hypothetical protein